jgi:hypothetical protein
MHLNQHSMKRAKLIVVLIATLMSPAAISAPALAGDQKVYAGNTCKPLVEDGNTGLNYASNATTNLGGTDIDVICPVVRENAGGAAAGGVIKASIDVDSSTVSCSFTVTQPNGLGIFVNPTAVPVSIGGGVFSIDILGIPQIAHGAYYIACTIPPNQAVLRYVVSE